LFAIYGNGIAASLIVGSMHMQGNITESPPPSQIASFRRCTDPRRHWRERRAMCLSSRHLFSRQIACLLPDRLATTTAAVGPGFQFSLLWETNVATAEYIIANRRNAVFYGKVNKDTLGTTQPSLSGSRSRQPSWAYSLLCRLFGESSLGGATSATFSYDVGEWRWCGEAMVRSVHDEKAE
jgi:hypothetical protein